MYVNLDTLIELRTNKFGKVVENLLVHITNCFIWNEKIILSITVFKVACERK